MTNSVVELWAVSGHRMALLINRADETGVRIGPGHHSKALVFAV